MNGKIMALVLLTISLSANATQFGGRTSVSASCDDITGFDCIFEAKREALERCYADGFEGYTHGLWKEAPSIFHARKLIFSFNCFKN